MDCTKRHLGYSVAAGGALEKQKQIEIDLVKHKRMAVVYLKPAHAAELGEAARGAHHHQRLVHLQSLCLQCKLCVTDSCHRYSRPGVASGAEARAGSSRTGSR